MKKNYPDGKQDLYGAFILRGMQLSGDGLLGIVIGDTWMAIKSFEALRHRMLSGRTFNSFVHLRDSGNLPGRFGANAAFVLSRSTDPSQRSIFIRTSAPGPERKEDDFLKALEDKTQESGYYIARTSDFDAVPGSPIAFWLSENLRNAFQTLSSLGELVTISHGLTTGDNDRWLRYWWEVSNELTLQQFTSGPTRYSWVSYIKGGAFRRWYGNVHHIVWWKNNGESLKSSPNSVIRSPKLYFEPTVNWSDVSSGSPSFRRTYGATIHGNKGNSIFSQPETLDKVLSILNSRVSECFLEVLAPTLSSNVGDISRIPIAGHLERLDLGDVQRMISIAKLDWDTGETANNFQGCPLITSHFSRFHVQAE